MILHICPYLILILNPPFPYFRQTLKTVIWNYWLEFFYVCSFLKQKNFTTYETTTTSWKSKHTAFQNTKKFWKRCNTHEVRRIFVLESKSVNDHLCWVCTMLHINAHAWYNYIHYMTINVNHCSHTYDFWQFHIPWSNADFGFITQIFLTSRVLHRF